MKLSACHLEFWNARHAPAWAGLALKAPARLRPPAVASRSGLLDHCINAHAGASRGDYLDALNLCGILRGKSGAVLLSTLERIAASPGTVINPQRRSAYARKWARKIRANNPTAR